MTGKKTRWLVGALVLGTAYLGCAIHFSRRLTLRSAKQLFFSSIIYLPLLLTLLVVAKVK